MARPSTGANLNIAQLEQILNSRKSEITKLVKQRKDIQKKLDAVDREIDRLGGGGGGGALGSNGSATKGTRARNDKSLPEVLEEVLKGGGRAMKIAEISDAVLATGYRTTSDNFRSIVNQTLIKERKRFANSGERGMYQLKK